MAGKTRPSLLHKTLKNVALSNLSLTDKKCIESVFEKYEALSKADVVEVKRGTWSRGKEMSEYAHCSACNRKMNSFCYGYAHCPNCGAKMDGRKAE